MAIKVAALRHGQGDTSGGDRESDAMRAQLQEFQREVGYQQWWAVWGILHSRRALSPLALCAHQLSCASASMYDTITARLPLPD